MSTQVLSHVDTRRWTAQRLAIWLASAAVAAVAAYFWFTTIPKYFHYDRAHYIYYWPKRWWLIAHIGGGSLALVTGLFQFSGAIRKRWPKVHRWTGRIYLLGVLVGSIGAVYLGLVVSPIRAFGISLEFLALAWVLTSLMAYIAARRRQFAAHKEWMTRSYVVTFGFVLFRIGTRNHVLGNLGFQMQSVVLSWACWAVPLLITDVVQRWRATMGPVRRQPAAARLVGQPGR